MRSFLARAGAIASIVLLSGAASAQQPVEMPSSASTCLSCHGANGDPPLLDVPIIAGQQELYLRNALHAYRAGHRTEGQALVMQQIVKTLGDDEIDALAKWFGEQ